MSGIVLPAHAQTSVPGMCGTLTIPGYSLDTFSNDRCNTLFIDYLPLWINGINCVIEFPSDTDGLFEPPYDEEKMIYLSVGVSSFEPGIEVIYSSVSLGGIGYKIEQSCANPVSETPQKISGEVKAVSGATWLYNYTLTKTVESLTRSEIIFRAK